MVFDFRRRHRPDQRRSSGSDTAHHAAHHRTIQVLSTHVLCGTAVVPPQRMNEMAQSSDEFSGIVTRVLEDNTAQSVFNHLKALESIRDHVRTRWVWELLQNARDASVGSGTKLVTRIEQNEDELVFEHNGESFSLEETAHLIYHDSTKVENEETIGQYGSGFLTTHLLSPEINVSGRITDGRYFDFRMRREINSVSELRESMRDSARKFEDSLSQTQAKCAPFILVFNQNCSTSTSRLPTNLLGRVHANAMHRR